MSTIGEHVTAMGVDPAELRDSDEYVEVIHTLVVGPVGTAVKDQADLINPANGLQPGDVVQVRRVIGTLGDSVSSLAGEVTADDPVLYLADSVDLDGVQGKVPHSSLGLMGAFSVEAWITPVGPGSVGSTVYGTVFGISGTRRLLWGADQSRRLVRAEMGGTGFATPANSVPVGERTHVVYTYDGSMERLYVNGAVLASQATASGPSFTNAFWEGAYGDPSQNYSLKGALDNRAFYDHALPADRVLAHTQAGT